jgi:quercetin dioxygenase-like cupin family protein
MAASTDRLLVVRPGAGKRSGDVEFLATSDDTPRLNVCTILIDPWSKGVPPHEHAGEDDAFYVLEGEVTFDGDDGAFVAAAGTFVLARPGVAHGFHNHTGAYARLLNIHAPAGFDVRFLADRAGPDGDDESRRGGR